MIVGGAAAVIAAIPLLANPRFFYMDDTQAGAVGVWSEVGRYLVERHGIPLLIPSSYPVGNVLVEGQWGVFHPFFLLFGLATFLTGRLLLVATVVKILGLVIAGTGGYLAARSYGASHRWATLAGLAVPFIGFTLYMDAPSWVTGLFVFAFLTWTVWGLRRFSVVGGLPLVPFVSGYLVVTVGYVHGTLMLALTVFCVSAEALIERRIRGAVRVLAVGLCMGLVAAFIFLPGLLSSGVTWRTVSGVTNSGYLAADPSVLLSSFVPTMRPWMPWFSGTGAVAAPLTYCSWLLLAVPLVRWRDVPASWRSWSGLLILFAGAAALTFGPSEITPLRSPVRLMPYIALCLILLVVVFGSRFGLELSVRRVAATAVVAAVGGYLSFAKAPAAWLSIGAGTALALVAVVAVAVVERLRPQMLPLVGFVTGSLVVTMQVVAMPSAPVADWGFPTSSAAFKAVAPTDGRQLFVVGDPRAVPDPWATSTFASGWMVAGVPTGNGYTPVGFAAFQSDLCQDTYGVTCAASVDKLFSVDPTTGVPLADLLQVDVVQLLAVPGVDLVRQPPSGWHVESHDTHSVLWYRDGTSAPVGGVSWTQKGVRISGVTASDTQISFIVDAVPDTGGKVVLSRLAWPGYTVNGAKLDDPLRGYLLTVDVDASAIGQTVAVSFAPPAWTTTVVLGASGVVSVLVWTILLIVASLRRRRRDARIGANKLLPAIGQVNPAGTEE